MNEYIEKMISLIGDQYVDEAVKNMMRHKKPHRQLIRKLTTTAAAILFFCFAGLGGITAAVASGSFTAYDILHKVYPEIAEKLTPVNLYCEDKGIGMKVEAVHIEENKASVLVSIQDVTGQDRLDEMTDLSDSYQIKTTADVTTGCRRLSYDAETGKATFLIQIEQQGKIDGQKVEFTFSKLLTGKTSSTVHLDQISEVQERTETIPIETVEVNGRSGAVVSGITSVDNIDKRINQLLACDSSGSFSVSDSVYISNWGFVDGFFHIQVHYKDVIQFDNHCCLYLKNGEKVLYPSENVSFWDETGKGVFCEYCFEITPESFYEWEVWGDFSSYSKILTGDWYVSLLVDEMGKSGGDIPLQGGKVQVFENEYSPISRVLRLHFEFRGEKAKEHCHVCAKGGYLIKSDLGQTINTAYHSGPRGTESSPVYEENGCQACDVAIDISELESHASSMKVIPYDWEQDTETGKMIPGSVSYRTDLAFTIDLEKISSTCLWTEKKAMQE